MTRSQCGGGSRGSVMKISSPEQRAAAIETVLQKFPGWSEGSRQRLRNLSDISWNSSSSATVAFTYQPGSLSILFQLTGNLTNVFKGQAPDTLSPDITGTGGSGSLDFDDLAELMTSGTEFHIFPNADQAPSQQNLVILFCDSSYLYGLFTYSGLPSIEGDAVEGTGTWS